MPASPPPAPGTTGPRGSDPAPRGASAGLRGAAAAAPASSAPRPRESGRPTAARSAPSRRSPPAARRAGEVTDPTHPLFGRRFPVPSDTRIADYSDTQLPPPQLSGPARAGARETYPATPGSARLHRGDTAAPPRRDARAHGRRTSSHLRRKPRRRPTAPWSGGAGA